MTALLLGPEEKTKIADLLALAMSRPVDIKAVMQKVATVEGKAAHMQAMTEQSIHLPLDYFVTFSIEENHPIGTARHVSVSLGGTDQHGFLPNPAAVWAIALELGFTGKDITEADLVWMEHLQGHGQAVNVVQVMR